MFEVDGGVTASISGLTITGGNVTGYYSAVGGGLLNYGGTTLATNCTVSGNSTSSTSNAVSSLNGGGGIANLGGTLTLTNCTVSNNAASTFSGFFFDGGGGGINNTGTLSLTNCTVSGNSVTSGFYGGGSGGGIINFRGTAILTNCTVNGNSCSRRRRSGDREPHRRKHFYGSVPLRRGYDHPEPLHRKWQHGHLQWRRPGHIHRHDYAQQQAARQWQLRRQRRWDYTPPGHCTAAISTGRPT